MCTIWEVYSPGKLATGFFCSQLHNLVNFRLPPHSPAPPSVCLRLDILRSDKRRAREGSLPAETWACLTSVFRKPSGRTCGLSVCENLGMGQWPGKVQVCQILLVADNVWKTLDLRRFINVHQAPEHRVIRNQNTIASF